MKVLALDTSSLVAGVAIMDDDRLIAEYNLNHKKTHSQKLMPMIMDIMKSVELTPKDIDVYAASSGPGSFTGLRIGITTVKAIAYSLNKPVVGVPTLDALAYNIPMTQSIICPIMDARNNQVYTAIYKWDNTVLDRQSEYMGIPVAELVSRIKERAESVVFVGDGVPVYKDFLIGELGERCGFAPANLQLQKGASVAKAAIDKINKGLTESPFDMVPFYLRKSQAERMMEMKTC